MDNVTCDDSLLLHDEDDGVVHMRILSQLRSHQSISFDTRASPVVCVLRTTARGGSEVPVRHGTAGHSHGMCGIQLQLCSVLEAIIREDDDEDDSVR